MQQLGTAGEQLKWVVHKKSFANRISPIMEVTQTLLTKKSDHVSTSSQLPRWVAVPLIVSQTLVNE